MVNWIDQIKFPFFNCYGGKSAGKTSTNETVSQATQCCSSFERCLVSAQSLAGLHPCFVMHICDDSLLSK